MIVRRYEVHTAPATFHLETVTRSSSAVIVVLEGSVGCVALVRDSLVERMRRVGMCTELDLAGVAGVRLGTDGALELDEGGRVPAGWRCYSVAVHPRILRKAAAALLVDLEQREAQPHTVRVTEFAAGVHG